MILQKVNNLYRPFFSEIRKKQIEKLIFLVAIIAFIMHFSLIVFANLKIIPVYIYGAAGSISPIQSIYTPFSIILLYEIYLLIYYLPKSITIYIGKQYEIIALIVIRKTFDDLANLSIINGQVDIFSLRNLLLTFVALIILFLLIFSFYKLSGSKKDRIECYGKKERRFLAMKEILSLGLLAIFIILFIISIVDFSKTSISVDGIIGAIKTINNTFFNTFFTALILTEVLLLLFTFNLSDRFSKVIRNSGFIISTVLLKLSFLVEGFANIVIILIAVSFGLSVMGVYRLFEKKL